MTDTALRLERIRSRLADRAKPWITTEQCLTEAQIVELEQSLHITLPEEYRLFLKEIGDGAVSQDLSGVFSLLPDEISGYRPDKPFPLTEGWLWAGGDEDSEPESKADLKYACLHDGQLPLCDQGIEEIWALVVTGPERGNMWLVTASGVAPPTPRCGFLEWFEAWMDKRLGGFNLVGYDTHGEVVGA